MKLRIKLCLVATGPMCIAVLLQILYFATDSERRTIDTLSEKARSLTPLLINLVGPNLALDDLAATAEVLGYVKKDPDFYAAAVVRNGKVVAEVGDVAALARATDLSVIPASLDVQVHGTTVVAQ